MVLIKGFKFKGQIYTVRFKSSTMRLGVHLVWMGLDERSGSEGIALYHPSGRAVTMGNPSDRPLRAVVAKQAGVDVAVLGMIIYDFKSETRIVSIDGNRAVVSADPADWLKEEE